MYMPIMWKGVCKRTLPTGILYYWNNVTPTKRNNTTRISPANEQYYREVIEPSMYEDFDDDQGWDAHKDY